MMNEVVKEVRNMLRTSMGSSYIKTFYAGRVGLPATNYMPCVIVEEVGTQMERQSTVKDIYRFSLLITVIVDVRKDFSVAGVTSDEIVDVYQTLRNVVEEADTDGAPKTTSILGALTRQANLRGTNYVYSMNPRVNYRPVFPGMDEFWYAAATIEIDMLADFITRKA